MTEGVEDTDVRRERRRTQERGREEGGFVNPEFLESGRALSPAKIKSKPQAGSGLSCRSRRPHPLCI